jgi:uncharacterized membrane protein
MHNTNNSSSKSGQLSAAFVLFIVFLVMKLAHVINWSWWLIFMPLYAGFALVLMLSGFALVIGLIVAILAFIFDSRDAKKRRKAIAARRANLRK